MQRREDVMGELELTEISLPSSLPSSLTTSGSNAAKERGDADGAHEATRYALTWAQS